MQACHESAGHHSACINIALIVNTANNTTLAKLKSTFQNFVLAVNVNFGKHQSSCPANGGMA